MAIHIPYFVWILAAALGVGILTLYVRRKFQPVSTAGRRRTFPVNQDNSESTCIICCENPVETRFEPCGHSVMCDTCSSMYIRYSNKCPFCRVVIEKHSPVP